MTKTGKNERKKVIESKLKKDREREMEGGGRQGSE